LIEFASVVGAVECALPLQQLLPSAMPAPGRTREPCRRWLLRYGPEMSVLNWRERLAEETIPGIFGPAA
jgi:hypothetical protein